MKQAALIPVINKGFQLYYFSPKNQSYDWLKRYNKSPETFSQLEPLFRLHRHDVLEILVFLGGECEFFCEGKTYSLKRGDIVVIPPYAVHKAIVKSLDSYERIIISVSEHLMDEFVSSSPSMKENVVYHKTQGSYLLHLHSKNFQDIISLLHELNDRLKKGEDAFSFSLHYLLFQVLQIVFDPASNRPDISNKEQLDQRFASILEYIESNLTDSNLSLERISEQFHLNKYYFSHYFKKNMSLPFYRYVSLKRLSFAVTMIKQNQLSMEKISLNCGFPDYSSFYRLFKKEYTISPKKFQREYRNLE